MSKPVHHINDDGTAAVCTAPDDAKCHARPRCDAETWTGSTCDDHDGAHRVIPSADCWMVEWINGADLEDNYGYYGTPSPERPGAPIEISFKGIDEGCSWTYAEVTP